MSATAPHLKPIVLVPVRARQATDGDTGPVIPNSIPLGLYESHHDAHTAARNQPVPPLAYFCIRTLTEHADQVYSLGSHRIRCQPQVLRALSPSAFGDTDATTRCLCKLDPRVWSIIVQVYSDLPKGFQNYHIPLGDRHLPLLQSIPSTPSFALITALNLTRCVSDETSHVLKTLHGLCTLDISRTSISHLGIRHFAPTITSEPSDAHYGTRGLRILRLCDCPKITNQIIDAVSNFQLLAILDLRGTSCNRGLDSGVFRPSRKSQRNLFQCSLQDALRQLKDSDSRNILFSHPDPFVIHINKGFHPSWSQRPDRQKPAPDTFTFLRDKSGMVASTAASSATASIYERLRRYEDSWDTQRSALDIPEEERELREWISLMLADAGTEARISKIAHFVTQRWEYNPERFGPDGSPSPHDSGSGYPWGEDDSIDSWDEDSEDNSTEPRAHFCGFEVGEDLMEKVSEMVEETLEEHETVTRFYGLESRAQKAETCHCGELRGTAISPAETMPADRHLMLVRDPPSWDSVYGPDAPPPQRIRITTKPSLSNSPNLSLDRSSIRAKMSTQEMLDMIAQRRNLPTTTTLSSPASTPTVRANPFRKDPNTGPTRGELKDRPRGHRDSVQGGNPDPVPDSRTPKRMKSIFQIPVPPRPTPAVKSQSQRVKGSGGSGMVPKKLGKLKQTTLSEVFGKRT